eukprot:scaffold1669_cov129-Cylindrotheca_fusiformis.AAC.65
MRKSSSHRKRHVPPGPVGIWFQTQQQLHSNKQRNGDAGSFSQERTFLQRHSASQESDPNKNDNNSNNKTCNDLTFSPVWSSVQQSLNIVTPYLPAWSNDPKQRYEWLRPHLPSDFILVWEIICGEYDFTTPEHSRLLLLVSSIESHNLHNIWTVELQDETGATIRAWMEPSYVKEQMQQQHESSSTIRPGVIWMITGAGMMVQTNEHEEKLERILLIGGKHIVQVWTPEQAKQNDSKRSDVDFLQWMEQRKAKSTSIPDMEDIEEPDDANKENRRNCSQEWEENLDRSPDQLGHCDESNDWISLLRKRDKEDENHQSLREGSTSSRSLPREPAQQQTSQALHLGKGQGLDKACTESPESPETQQCETSTNSYVSHHIQQSQHEAASCDVHISRSADDSQGIKRAQHTNSSAGPNKVRKHTQQQSKQSHKCNRISPKWTTKALEKSPSSILWDNIQETSVIQLLEDDESDEDGDQANLPPGTRKARQNEEQEIDKESPPVLSTTCEPTNERLGIGAMSQSVNVEAKSTPTSQLRTSSCTISLFDASNFNSLDLSLFDDD